jgi:hypothetical protein
MEQVERGQSRAVTQAEFAKICEVDRSTVTRWKAAGRLVMTPKGRVLVEDSLRRVEDTKGHRDDVAERHAGHRAAKRNGGATPPPPPRDVRGGHVPTGAAMPAADDSAHAWPRETRADAQARKDSLAADLLEMEVAEKRRNLIPREDVDAALRFLGSAVRSTLEVLADQQAPILAPVQSLDETHALLSEASRGALQNIADEMDRRRRELLEGDGQ